MTIQTSIICRFLYIQVTSIAKLSHPRACKITKHEISILAKHQTATDHALLVLTADYGRVPNRAPVVTLEQVPAAAEFKPLVSNDYSFCAA
jgi:uncharacterized protein YejL (UPF0352 family)